MTPTEERRAMLMRWRDECEAVLQQLATGRLRVQVRAETGEMVAYTPTDELMLRARLREIDTELGRRPGAVVFRAG